MTPHSIGFTLAVMKILTARQRPFLFSLFFSLRVLSFTLTRVFFPPFFKCHIHGLVIFLEKSFHLPSLENRFSSPWSNTLKQYLFLRGNTCRISCNMISMCWCHFWPCEFMYFCNMYFPHLDNYLIWIVPHFRGGPTVRQEGRAARSAVSCH